MRKWILPLIILLSLLVPASAGGQEALTLGSLEVSLWPEYDRPSMLVIYHITLSPATSVPVALSFRIPAGVGEPNAIASRQPDGSLLNLEYSLQPSGDWIVVSFTATTSEAQLEYYDPSLSRDDSNVRHFTYLWPGDYALASFFIQVQRPQGATDMSTSPSLGTGNVGSDGLTYYTVDIGSVPAGQTAEISLSYQKPDDSLTIESLQVQPSAPIPQDTAGNISLSSVLPWVLGALGVALLVGGVLWYVRSGKQASPAARRRGPRKRAEGLPSGGKSGEDTYCHSCGRRSAAGDVFCRACGSRLRSD